MTSQALDTIDVSAYSEMSTKDIQEKVLAKLQKFQASVMKNESISIENSFNDVEGLDDIDPPTPVARGMLIRRFGEECNESNGTKNGLPHELSWDTLELLDVDGAPDPDEDMYQWLVPSEGEELFDTNKSWMDTRLLDAQYRLLNVVKEKIFEMRSVGVTRSAPVSKVIAQENSDDRFKTYKRPARTAAHPQQTSGLEYVSNPAEIFTSPVRTRSLWNEYRNNTPNFSPIAATQSSGSSHYISTPTSSTPASDNSETKLESPTEKQEVDYRTFTRASARNRLIPKSSGLQEYAQGQSPVPYVTSGTDTITIRPARLKYANRNMNLNETFIQSEESSENISQLSSHNSSYVIATGSNQNPNNVDLNASYTVDRIAEPTLTRPHNKTYVEESNGENGSPPQPVRNLSYIVEDAKKGDIHPRRASLTHNLSFTIERKEDTNNLNHAQDLNTTFDKSQEDISNHFATGGSNGSVNLGSLEELHTRARKQEESLKMSSPSRIIARRDTHVIEIPNIDGSMTLPRPPPRTSSTDTYCVGQSNPDSPQSSGLSSPLDSQSYDDISSESFRRSMPNLAINKRLSINAGLSLASPLSSLQPKNYHTSDSKLSHPKEYSTLTITKPRTMKSITRPVINDYSGREMHMGQRYTGSSIQPTVYRAGSGEIPRQSALKSPLVGRLPAPRYTSVPKPTYMPTTGNMTSLPSAPGSIQMQASRPAVPSQIPGVRMTSRIPGPGISRLRPPSSRPSSGSPRYSSIPKQSEWQDGCY